MTDTHPSHAHPTCDSSVGMLGKLLFVFLVIGTIATVMVFACVRKAYGAELLLPTGSTPVHATLFTTDKSIPIPEAPTVWTNPVLAANGVGLEVTSRLQFVPGGNVRIRTIEQGLAQLVPVHPVINVRNGVRTPATVSQFSTVVDGFGIGAYHAQVLIPLTAGTHFVANYEFTVPFAGGVSACEDEQGDVQVTYWLGYPHDSVVPAKYYVDIDGVNFVADTVSPAPYVGAQLEMDLGTYQAFFAGERHSNIGVEGVTGGVSFTSYLESSRPYPCGRKG